MSQNDHVLDVRDLSVSFRTGRGKVRALRHVDITVPKNKIVGIVGESGCGKSTLINSVLRLLALYSIGRFTIEAFRGDKIRGLWWEGVLPGFEQGISTSQLVSTVLFAVCVTLLLKNRGRREEAAGTLSAAAPQTTAP